MKCKNHSRKQRQRQRNNKENGFTFGVDERAEKQARRDWQERRAKEQGEI